MSTLVIEHLKASELPEQWAQRLNVRPEQTVTVRIETEVEAANEDIDKSFVTNDPAFGIWRDHTATTDVANYVRELRAPRYDRTGSRKMD